MPCIPATKMKSPALLAILQVPSVLIAPVGLRVWTPLGDCDCAKPLSDIRVIAIRQARASRCGIGEFRVNGKLLVNFIRSVFQLMTGPNGLLPDLTRPKLTAAYPAMPPRMVTCVSLHSNISSRQRDVPGC